jgi:hypothetical protein
VFVQWLMWWRYSPLTRTQRKLLTCGFATLWRSPDFVCAPRPSAKCPESLLDHLDERDITKLITAYRDGATDISLAAVYGLSFNSVKRVLDITVPARPHPLNEL